MVQSSWPPNAQPFCHISDVTDIEIIDETAAVFHLKVVEMVQFHHCRRPVC
jgi:hypothetical protein